IDETNGLRKVIKDQNLGSIYPDWMLGISNTFTYKGVSLSGLLDIRHGGVFYSGTVANLRTSGLAVETGGDRTTTIIDEGLVDKGAGLVENDVPVKSHQEFWQQNYKVANSEANVFDASYIKLREVTLSYTLPNHI